MPVSAAQKFRALFFFQPAGSVSLIRRSKRPKSSLGEGNSGNGPLFSVLLVHRMVRAPQVAPS